MNRFVVCSILFVLSAIVSASCAESPKQADTSGVTSGITSIAAPVRGLPSLAPKQVEYVASCNIEQVNGQPASAAAVSLSRGTRLDVSGWAVDEASHDAPAHAFLVLQGTSGGPPWSVPIIERLSRDDVSGGKKGGVLSGFHAVLDVSALESGEYHMYTFFWQGGSAQSCDNGRRVVIQ